MKVSQRFFLSFWCLFHDFHRFLNSHYIRLKQVEAFMKPQTKTTLNYFTIAVISSAALQPTVKNPIFTSVNGGKNFFIFLHSNWMFYDCWLLWPLFGYHSINLFIYLSLACEELPSKSSRRYGNVARSKKAVAWKVNAWGRTRRQWREWERWALLCVYLFYIISDKWWKCATGYPTVSATFRPSFWAYISILIRAAIERDFFWENQNPCFTTHIYFDVNVFMGRL